jgi:2-polyprenyl-3-methyl-5-hydroxy-6-metoxy-1,4-benzoquinol methylase
MFGGSKLYHYHRCTECGLIYQHPIPSKEEIAAFYPESYSIYSEPERTFFSKRKLRTLKESLGYQHLEVSGKRGFLDKLRLPRQVPEVVPYVKAGSALDIGCGSGEYLLRLQSIGWKCQGVEFNEKAVSICRANGLNVFHGDLLSANFDSESFDFVTAHHLIEHAPDPHELVSEISRITKPGGSVLIRTPNSESLGRAWFGSYWFANEVPRHIFLYSEKNLRILASKYGLRLDSLSKPVKPKLILRSLDYKLSKRGVPSKKRKIWKFLSKLYTPAAKLSGRGDELFALFRKI